MIPEKEAGNKIRDSLKCTRKESFDSDSLLNSIFKNMSLPESQTPEGFAFLDDSKVFKIETLSSNLNSEVTSKKLIIK